MKNSKRRTKVLLLLATSVAIFIAAGYIAVSQNGLVSIFSSGDFEVYRCIDSMTSRATDIVRGEIIDVRVGELNTLLPPRTGPDEWYLERRHDFYEIHTIHRIRVVEVFMGDAQAGDIMEIAQLGGRMGLINSVNDGRLEFVIGDDLVFS